MKRFCIIMAGGDGTRFWPLSRQKLPKQLLNLSGKGIMLNETIKRNMSLIPKENMYVVANKKHKDILRKVLTEDIKEENILFEPVGRNTAACIGYAALAIAKRHGESVICVMPSDAYIHDAVNYMEVIKNACKYAESSDNIVMVGIQPNCPATGYGYIKHEGEALEENVYKVDKFVEKPDRAKAVEYLREGIYFWNSGIFVCRTSVLLKAYKCHLPKLYNQLKALVVSLDTEEHEEIKIKAYADMQSISVDYGILEKCADMLVVPGDFGWNDIGTWDALGNIFSKDENDNVIRANHVGLDTKNSFIYGTKLIATIGLENMIVVETEDALLVCSKERAQDVKLIVELLKGKGKLETI